MIIKKLKIQKLKFCILIKIKIQELKIIVLGGKPTMITLILAFVFYFK